MKDINPSFCAREIIVQITIRFSYVTRDKNNKFYSKCLFCFRSNGRVTNIFLLEWKKCEVVTTDSDLLKKVLYQYQNTVLVFQYNFYCIINCVEYNKADSNQVETNQGQLS